MAFALFLAILAIPNDSPVPAADAAEAPLSGAAQRLAAVTLLMAGLWVTQTMPIAVTALLPLVLFPFLGIQTAEAVSASYIDRSVFLFLGGFVIALGIERWGLHRRIALGTVAAVGGSPRRIVLGFMLATAFLSMWISNTASTLLMLPIGLALLDSLATATRDTGSGPPDETAGAPDTLALDRLGLVLMLGIAYSASIGGFSTLVGTPTNAVFRDLWARRFPAAPEFSSGNWMLAVLPMGVTLLAATWGMLVWRLPAIPNAERLTRSFFRDRFRALGRTTVAERRMAVLFAATALLWITRARLEFGSFVLFPGWGSMVSSGLVRLGWVVPDAAGELPRLLDDSTVAIGVMVLMFLIPSGERREGRPVPLMDWATASRLPWDILLLFGGGLALADGFTSTGLSRWLGGTVGSWLEGSHPVLVVLAVCLLMTFLTEVTSNVATVSALIPVLASAAVGMGVDPRLVCLPAVVSASCAFMLPIATPPNAIVFGSGRVSMPEMVRYGLILNLVGAIVITVLTFVFLVPQFGIVPDVVPTWAE